VNEDSERVEKRAEAYRIIQAQILQRTQEDGLEQELLALGRRSMSVLVCRCCVSEG
jgi:hypothetical protein